MRAGGSQVQTLGSNVRLSIAVTLMVGMRGRARIPRQAAIVEAAKARETLLGELGEGTGEDAIVASKQAGVYELATQIELE